jgi:hypothetical protein
VGAAGLRYHENIAGSSRPVSTRGLSGMFELAAGGSVVGNLILHANVSVLPVGDAFRDVSGVRDTFYDHIHVDLGLVGGGLTYYFMPNDAYVTGVLGVAGMSETRDDDRVIRSHAGLGSSLSIGKEWWAGSEGEWGLGAALSTSFYTAKANVLGEYQRLYGTGLAVAFSATLN